MDPVCMGLYSISAEDKFPRYLDLWEAHAPPVNYTQVQDPIHVEDITVSYIQVRDIAWAPADQTAQATPPKNIYGPISWS